MLCQRAVPTCAHLECRIPLVGRSRHYRLPSSECGDPTVRFCSQGCLANFRNERAHAKAQHELFSVTATPTPETPMPSVAQQQQQFQGRVLTPWTARNFHIVSDPHEQSKRWDVT